MEKKIILEIVLRTLYPIFFQSKKSTGLTPICEDLGMNNDEFFKIIDELIEEGYIRARTAGDNYQILLKGIIRFEETGANFTDLVEKNQKIRDVILDKLAVVRESFGPLNTAYVRDWPQELGVDDYHLIGNLLVLEEEGYIVTEIPGSYKITLDGVKINAERKERESLTKEFEEISLDQPQHRGRAFQKLLAKIIEKEGWFQEEGLRTSNEEMDIMIHKQREYFLIECKWEKDSIEASVIRELYGKLENRIGIQGILASMSGFTQGAVEQAEDFANKRAILLFGSKDILDLVYGRLPFEKVLST